MQEYIISELYLRNYFYMDDDTSIRVDDSGREVLLTGARN